MADDGLSMRDQTLESLADRHFDVLVIGAGINGAGIARDAAMRGLSVLLVDKGDVSAGTTSWSTRLVHGGLRYLEHYEVGLVRESLRERERLLKIAPHLVRPLSMLIPIYERDKRGPALVRLGMLAYDVLSLDKSLDHHHMLSAEDALAREPGLSPDGLRGAAVYYDAQVEYPERLAVENALAAQGAGATLVTYAKVRRLVVESNVARGIELTDVLGGGSYVARGEVVVNVAGPWVDAVLEGAQAPPPQMIGGTKGSHMVVERFRGAPSEALYVEAQDGRPYFIVAWNDLYLIGTTDERYAGDLDLVVAEDHEIEYLIEETNRVIPGAGLRRESVLYTYAGVRPLPHVADGATGGITRRHVIHDHAPDLAAQLISIVGGKITTYRNLAEQTVDMVFKKLGRPNPGCDTGEVPLPGAPVGVVDALKARLVADGQINERTAARLVRVYGGRAGDVLEVGADADELREQIGPEPATLGAEVVHALRHEQAQTLMDVFMRRTMIGLGPRVGLGADEAAAAIAVRHCGWDAARAERELEGYRSYVERYRPRSAAPA